jgi:hypothetical protein
MESHKLSTVAYALGFVSDWVEKQTEPLMITEGLDQTMENEQREQVRAMMAVLEDGMTRLMAENGRLLNKIAMAELALKS